MPGADMNPVMELALRASFGSVAQALQALRDGGEPPRLVFVPGQGRLACRRVEGDAVLLELHGPVGPALHGIDWGAVQERYRHAVEAASADCAATVDEARTALLLDVRRAAVFEAADAQIAGAVWRDPGEVGHWSSSLPRGRELIVYCVHGHEVSRCIALRLRAEGLPARYLQGGIEAWRAAGLPLQARSGET